MRAQILFIFLFYFSSLSFAGEAELFVELENLKNEVKVSGYSKEAHEKILKIYESNKSQLSNYSNPSLKKELVGLVRSSVLVQKLKDCVGTGHEKINLSIDSVFIAAANSGCIGEVFSDQTIQELSSDTDKILEVINTEEYNAEDLRQELFEKSLPSLIQSFDKSRSKFKDTDDKFLATGNELFPMLPADKRNLNQSQNTNSPTYQESSHAVLGPINDLYKEVYGDKAESALSDQWKDVYSPTKDKETPHLFGSGHKNRTSQSIDEEITQCLAKASNLHDLQEKAQEHFSKLRAMSFQLGLSGIITEDAKMSEDYNQLGLASTAQCVTLKNGFSGTTPNMDRYGRPLSQELVQRGISDEIETSGSHVVMTLGNLGSDPNNVYTPIGRETLDSRSYLHSYTEKGIKEAHTKSLEGMIGFINHMGRRVYNTQADSTGQNLLNLAGDAAQTLTSLGDSTEVDIALLLMANPSQGMNALIENPMALNAFCSSFKALRNQENVNTAIEIASALSMFTGIGGMMVKGSGALVKGLRVSNMALAGADTISIVDSMTHARDLALASACEEGSESLCQSYLDSDRNMTLAIAGLALSGMGSVSAASKLTKRLRGAFLLRNGDNANGIIRDNHKLTDLLSKANAPQKNALLKIVNSNAHSDEDMIKIISLLQNNENGKTLDFLNQFDKLDDQARNQFLRKLIEKADKMEGGVCRLPS